MSFFGRGFYPTTEPNFTGLFRLIDDCYAHQNSDGSAQHGLQRHVPRHVPTFTPKFDVKETEANYELHGELPGIEKKDVHIEFTEPQTIVVRGRVERTYTAGTPPAGLLEKKPDEEMSGALTEGAGNGDDAVVVDRDEHETASNKSFQATVEDDNEDGKASTTTTATTGGAQPATTTTVDKKQNKPAAKYWVSERSVGEFSRSFSFPTRVASESVTASLDNGILTVVVPKAKKHESRRIAIN